jgi:hypothetical protein
MKTILLIILISILILVFIIYLKHFRQLRPKEEGFEFVYVENNGNVRELDNGEMEYLKEKFHPNDGGRPYIKTNYKQLTPDGKISGFIYRIKVPKNITIEKEKANA